MKLHFSPPTKSGHTEAGSGPRCLAAICMCRGKRRNRGGMASSFQRQVLSPFSHQSCVRIKRKGAMAVCPPGLGEGREDSSLVHTDPDPLL